MKIIITIVTILVGFASFAQSSSQRWESARFEKTVNNKDIHYFEVYAVNHEFTGINFQALVEEFYQKEGIIDLVQVSEKQINVFVYDLIKIDVVKSIFVLFDSEIELSHKKTASVETLNNHSQEK